MCLLLGADLTVFRAHKWRTQVKPTIPSQYKSINYVINGMFRKMFNTRSHETVDVCLEMFNRPQAEQTIAIRKRKFKKNKFSVINNLLCQIFVVSAVSKDV